MPPDDDNARCVRAKANNQRDIRTTTIDTLTCVHTASVARLTGWFDRAMIVRPKQPVTLIKT